MLRAGKEPHVYRFVTKRIKGSYFADDLVISSVNMSRTLQ